MADTKFILDWESGAGAQLELMCIPTPPAKDGTERESRYSIKYMPPLRTTIRTVQDLPFSSEILTQIDEGINQLIRAVNSRSGGGAAPPADNAQTDLNTFGDLLFNLVFSGYMAI